MAVIQYKTKQIESESHILKANNPIILEIALEYAKLMDKSEIVITSIFRPNVDSVHCYYRGLDIRAKHDSKDDVNEAVDMINADYARIDGKLTAIAHGEGDNFHVHIQTPDVDGAEYTSGGIISNSRLDYLGDRYMPPGKFDTEPVEGATTYKPLKTIAVGGELALISAIIIAVCEYFKIEKEVTIVAVPLILSVYKSVKNYMKNFNK